MRRFAVFVALALACATLAQQATGLDQFLSVIEPRELGPTVMGGRINSFAVYESDPRIYYVGTASGGVWKTENAGLTYRPVFYKESSAATGAVAVSQTDPNLVWVGTGEQNSRNSSSWGDGVYKSTDGGATWTNMGLRDSKHISEVRIHPTNPNIVYVAALGHLWGENDERGIYKTEDGGKTWTRILFESARSGFITLEVDPKNPNNMLAASWERMRWPYRWASGGAATFIYRTTNGGRTWSKAMKGIPEGDTGRIGISYFLKDPKIVVAVVEKAVTGQGANRKTDGGVYRSTDGGQSWTKVNDLNPRPFYFSQIHQDPVDENRIYLVAVQAYVSNDKGATWRTMRLSVHVDHHDFWVNPKDNNHLLIGNDGGMGESRDAGATWEHMNFMRLGQFYAVSVDMRKPYWVYGGLQDNGSWAGPTQTTRGGVTMHDWYGIGGGDGFHTQNDPEDWRIVYSESQGGAVGRRNQLTGEQRSIRPRGQGLRFNWSTPFIISPHNSKTLYLGSQFLHKSVDRGDNWQVISPDLTTNDESKQDPRGGVTPENTGAERHCTIVTVSESPVTPGLLWVGTDDGKVQVTRNGGQSWTDVTSKFAGVPANTWVSRVYASRFAEGRAFVSFDGHRNNDYKAYVFMTDDYGDTWTNITNNLPDGGSVYVVKEGLRNPDLLIAGTEFGLFFSNTRGASWARYAAGEWPTVRVDDVVIHPRELDLVVGTHGRSIWILPFWPLELLTAEAMAQDVFVCRPPSMYSLGHVSGGGSNGDGVWSAPNTQPSATFYYHLKASTTETVRVLVLSPDGTQVASVSGRGDAGLNSVVWRPGRQQRPAAGDYTVVLQVGEKEHKTTLKVEDLSQTSDPNAFLPMAK
ncbi:MAG: hypothetical protein WD716_11020 [Fimbriimonadaceae bacterium]